MIHGRGNSLVQTSLSTFFSVNLEEMKEMVDYRVSGYILGPHYSAARIEKVRKAKGLGRWIYCKYCDKCVLPMLSGIYQVVCSECGAGLTPDFFNYEDLLRWLKEKRKEGII
jgi:hypothetical protein